MDEIAPRPTAAAAISARADIGILELGRVLYTGRCANCHNPEPITRYSRTQWVGIIDRMAPESELDDAQKRAVLAYVMAFAK